MKRSPLVRRTELRSAGSLTRTARLRPVNPERAAQRRRLQFGKAAALIRALPCCVCSAPGPNHPHHVRSRGAGGTSDDLVALCPFHHDEIHRIGRHRFAVRYGVDLAGEAADLAAWLRRDECGQQPPENATDVLHSSHSHR